MFYYFCTKKMYIIYYIGQYVIAPTTKLFIDGWWLYVWFEYPYIPTNLLKRKIKKKK